MSVNTNFYRRRDLPMVLSVSLSTVDRLIRNKLPPLDDPIRVGRTILFSKKDINNYLKLDESVTDLEHEIV